MGAQWKTKLKEEAANARGRVFTKLVRELIVSARSGADPELNSRLRHAIEAARKASMPRDTLERAIKKGAGLLDEVVNYELITYEGYGPHQVPVIVECLTENRNRTVSSIRTLFRKGQLGSSGSVAWDFTYAGMIEASPEKGDADAELAAIEAGAQDFEKYEDGSALFITEPTDLDAVSKALPDFGFTVSSAKLGYIPKNPVTLEGDALAEVMAFLEAIDEDDDVQNVYAGINA